MNAFLDQVVKLQLLLAWAVITIVLRLNLAMAGDVRFALEMQAMSTWMMFQDPSMLPEIMREKLRRQAKMVLAMVLTAVWLL